MARKRFSESPINDKQEELSQKAEALEREIAKYKRLIAEAPQRRREEKRRLEQALREREERLKRQRVLRATTLRSAFDASDVLHDARHDLDAGPRRPAKHRRRQIRAARTQLAVMVVAVMIAAAFVLFLLIQLVHHLG